MLDGEKLFRMDSGARKSWILEYSSKPDFSPPQSLSDNLQQTYRLSRALEIVLPRYFQLLISRDLQKFEHSASRRTLIREKIDEYLPIALRDLHSSYQNLVDNALDNPKNLYELGGAMRLAFGSNATRTISTKLGLVWENIACLSPYAINPESEFGIKLEGVDAIILNGEELVYAQIKTQKNTLTGSQKGRAVQELSLHKRRLMVACFETSANWTFASPEVPRIAGEQFWSLLGFSYSEIVNELKRLMPLLDDEYRALFE